MLVNTSILRIGTLSKFQAAQYMSFVRFHKSRKYLTEKKFHFYMETKLFFCYHSLALLLWDSGISFSIMH